MFYRFTERRLANSFINLINIDKLVACSCTLFESELREINKLFKSKNLPGGMKCLSLCYPDTD